MQRVPTAVLVAMIPVVLAVLTIAQRPRDPNAARDAARDAWQHPDEVMDELGIKAGDRVADIGAGSGYFSIRLARRVGPRGKVFAVETDSGDLEIVGHYKKTQGLGQIELTQGSADNPGLPDEALDAVLIVDTYHEFRDFDAMLKAAVTSLKTGGRLGIIDGQAPDGLERSVYHQRHSIAEKVVREDVARSGLDFVKKARDFFDAEYDKPMYFLIFEKP